MRIAYNTWSMATVPYETFVPALADIGFGAIAISVVPHYSIGGRRVDNAGALGGLSSDDRRHIKQAFRERGLLLPSIIGNQSLVEPDADSRRHALDFLRQAVDLCVELAPDGEVPTLNTGTGGTSGDLEHPSTQALIVDGLGELADYAATRGVVVCIEPHVNAPVDTIERAEWLVRTVGHASLRLDFDVSHFEVQDVPMEHSVPRLAPLAAAAEVKDQHCRVVGSATSGDGWRVPGNGEGRVTTPDGRELEFQFLLAGEGTFDLAAYLRLMQRQGFTRPIAFEASVQCQARPDYDALASARSIYQWMADAWQRAGIAPN
ncbi:MAG TPA: sugar phosphate isomerase/epimerase family protein [Chloroflexota bacterium]